MMIDGLAQLITFSACVAVIVITEPKLNLCTATTCRRISLALFLLCAGAVLLAASIIPGMSCSPWPGAAALSVGVAMLLFFGRRKDISRDNP